jgi:hypothetical protein
MRFLNVDDVESHSIAIILEQSIELGNLPAKGRSSIAAEYEDYGMLAQLGGKI